MQKIIKSYQTEEERILEYVRSPQESMNPSDAHGGNYVDPAMILAEAREEAERKVQEAYAEGLRRGEEAGRAQFEASVGNASEMLNALLERLEQQRGAFLSDLEAQLIEIVRLVSGKVLAREVASSEELLTDMVRRVLERLSSEERVSLRVNPADLECVRGAKADLQEQFDRVSQLDVISDESVESGGCIGETDALHIDAQLSAQLNQVLNGLKERAPEGAPADGDDD